MFFVSLGYNPGNLWFDYGTHQPLCHCHHMGTELVTPPCPPPLSLLSQIMHKSKEREKRAKETEYWIKKENQTDPNQHHLRQIMYGKVVLNTRLIFCTF